jgi:hypothetical protein
MWGSFNFIKTLHRKIKSKIIFPVKIRYEDNIINEKHFYWIYELILRF